MRERRNAVKADAPSSTSSSARAGTLREAGVALAVRAAIRALAWLPLPLAQRIGACAGALAWRIGVPAVRVTRANLRACFPELTAPEREALGRSSLMAAGRLAAEMGMIWHWPERRWRRAIASVEGDEHIEAALAERRGVILMVPHFGNWELLNLYIGRRFGATALYDPPRIAALEPVIRRARTRAGSTLVPLSAAGLRAVYRALQRGALIGLLPDQVPSREAGVYAPFFGRPALTMTLAGRLMRNARGEVLLAAARRLDGGAFALQIEPLPHPGPQADDIALATVLNGAIERLVRRCPEQYLWAYKRFKRPPPGSAALY